MIHIFKLALGYRNTTWTYVEDDVSLICLLLSLIHSFLFTHITRSWHCAGGWETKVNYSHGAGEDKCKLNREREKIRIACYWQGSKCWNPEWGAGYTVNKVARSVLVIFKMTWSDWTSIRI